MKRSRVSSLAVRSLTYDDHYVCPICAHGELSTLVMTEAFGCNFCRHIFAVNLPAQSVQVIDSAQPITWDWTGQRWQVSRSGEQSLTGLAWALALLLACLPALIIALTAYMFPPLTGSPARFSGLWTAATLLAHLLIVLWLIAEHYQWPWYVTAKIVLRH